MRNEVRQTLAALAAAGIMLPTPGMVASQPRRQGAQGTVAIVGAMLVDGHGGLPLHNSVVIVEGDKIKAVGTVDSLKPPPGAKIIDGRGKTVMPGLIDMHCHVDIVGHGVYGEWHPYVKKHYKEILPGESKDLLMAGVTTGREPGGFLETDLWVRDSIARGDFPGPRRLVSGPYISFGDPKTGDSGPHGDPNSENAHYLMVDTPETAREAAIYLLDKGVDLLKAYNNLTEPMVRAITEEAHKRGKHVASHVRGPEDLAMRIRAGVDTIEHMGGHSGGRFTQESLDLMAQQRVAVVPTLNVGLVYKETEAFPGRLEDPKAMPNFPPDVQDLIRKSNRQYSHLRYFDGSKTRNDTATPVIFKQLVDAGVTILMGTESGTPLNFHTSAAAREMVWMNKLGMSNMNVIVSSTRAPAQFLRMDDKYGSIEIGKVADVIMVDGNPLFDMAVMHQVSFVMKDGVIYKGDGSGQSSRTDSSR
ncbi:MAG: amidohydrolase family protein [Vicinamibacterales bacterium]